jgi:phosphatidylglycerophosphatase A
MTRLAVFISTFGYSGFFPFAPGTVGSLAGLIVYLGIERAGPSGVAHGAGILVLFGLGVWAGTRAEQHFRTIDAGPIVIDEVVGMLITLFLVPVGVTGAVAGFLLFRVFDIVKPFPAGPAERLPGGFGVMCDDAIAGIYANVCLRLLWWLVPAWIV